MVSGIAIHRLLALPLKIKVNLGVMGMKGYSTSHKALELEPSDGFVPRPVHTSRRWGSYLSAEMQSAYSTAPADWVN